MKSVVAVLLAAALGVSMPGIVATPAVAAPHASSAAASSATASSAETPDGSTTDATTGEQGEPTTPTPDPGTEPSAEPAPSPDPTEVPAPTEEPTAEPTAEPTTEPTPSAEPTPSVEPTPSATPTPTATEAPATEAPVAPESPARAPLAFGEVQTLAAGTFNPASIISDFNFFNSWAMTEAEIQAFLERQINAQGGCLNSNCLAAFRMNTPNASWSFGTCAAYRGAGGESAARIIYRVQRLCGLSAKVILVTLQKEQGLITSRSPSDGVMRKAMGMGCPDTSVCDSQFYGFFNQVYAAARQLVWYTNPGSSMYQGGRFRVGQPRPIQYSPNAACGSSIGHDPEPRHLGALLLHARTSRTRTASPQGGEPHGTDARPTATGTSRSTTTRGSATRTRRTPMATTRLGGNDRYETAVEISKDTYKSAGIPVVYIASGRGIRGCPVGGPGRGRTGRTAAARGPDGSCRPRP